jgi:ankyrin repeat protein
MKQLVLLGFILCSLPCALQAMIQKKVISAKQEEDSITIEKMVSSLAYLLNVKQPELVRRYVGLDEQTREKLDTRRISPYAKQQLKYLVDTQLCDREDNTLLLLAVRKDDEIAIGNLLELGADPTIADKGGNTPLHFAVSRDSAKDTIVLLLKYGAEINAQNGAGHTPLQSIMVSSRVGAVNYKGSFKKGLVDKKKIIQLLIEQGADTAIPDKAEKTVLDNAVKVVDANIDEVNFLLTQGAHISPQTVRLAKKPEIRKALEITQKQRTLKEQKKTEKQQP